MKWTIIDTNLVYKGIDIVLLFLFFLLFYIILSLFFQKLAAVKPFSGILWAKMVKLGYRMFRIVYIECEIFVLQGLF